MDSGDCMKECPYCGKENIDEALFCNFCGEDLQDYEDEDVDDFDEEVNAVTTIQPQSYILKVHRQYGSGGAMTKVNIFVDGTKVGAVGEGNTLDVQLSSGIHFVSLSEPMGLKTTVSVNAAGEDSTIRLEFKLTGFGGPKILHLSSSSQTVEQSAPSNPVTTHPQSNSIQPNNVDEMDGHDFEYYCAELLRQNGFTGVQVTVGSGDHGADILASKAGVKYAIQCKRAQGSVGNKAVQEAFTGKAFYRTDKAVVFTNSYFTKQAVNDAARIGVELWDRDVLHKLSKDVSIGKRYAPSPRKTYVPRESLFPRRKRAKNTGCALVLEWIIVLFIVFVVLYWVFTQ